MKRGSRLSGGRFRGRRLPAPPGVRPTEGRVREALASIWTSRLGGARLLDLFAGTGAVGLELLGRGAASLTLVERSPSVLRAARENVERLGAREVGEVSLHRLDLPGGLRRLAPRTFDLIFADPPYAFDEHGHLLAATAEVSAPDAELVIEHAAERHLEAAGGWKLAGRRPYGAAALTFFSRSG